MNKSTDPQLLIDAIRRKYPDNTGQFFFKSCGKKWIVVMEKVSDTITNQSRLPLGDPNRQFAKYRANKLKVIDIIHKFNPNETTDEIYNSYYKDHTIKYIKENIIISDSFDQNMDEVCSNGIHFYERIECAFYLELMGVENGKWTYWYDNGQKFREREYLNGKPNRKWTCWYPNGQKSEEKEYLNGKENGKWTQWYDDGQIKSKGEYKNGKENGKWTSWYNDGQQISEREYLNGKQNGKWTEWYINGQKREEEKYVNGVQNGKLTTWYYNGQKREEGKFLNGARNGKWIKWHDNGQKIEEREYLNGEKIANGLNGIKMDKLNQKENI